MTTEKSIDELLRKVQSAPDESLVAYSSCFEGLLQGEEPDVRWERLEAKDAPTMRAAVRLGLLSAEFRRWVPDYEGEQIPDGGDYVVTLSGLGTERIVQLNEPLLRRAKKQILENVPTIIVAVLISLASAWLLKTMGLTQ